MKAKKFKELRQQQAVIKFSPAPNILGNVRH